MSVPVRVVCSAASCPSTKTSKTAAGPISVPICTSVRSTSSSRHVASVVISSRAPDGIISNSGSEMSLCWARAHAGIRCRTIPPGVGSSSTIPAARTAPPITSTGASCVMQRSFPIPTSERQDLRPVSCGSRYPNRVSTFRVICSICGSRAGQPVGPVGRPRRHHRRARLVRVRAEHRVAVADALHRLGLTRPEHA